MRFVIQRVSESEVKVDGETLGNPGKDRERIYGADRREQFRHKRNRRPDDQKNAGTADL